MSSSGQRPSSRRKWTRAITKHQLIGSACPVALLLAINACLPAKFIYLSYLDPVSGLCLKGADDFYIVVFWIFLWTFLRALAMKWFWSPIARLTGVKRKVAAQIERFAEQGWGLTYAVISWFLGMAILCTSPYKGSYYLNPTPDLIRGYPHFSLTPLTKLYYLIQIAFWTQTIIALNIEKKRKDYGQMFAHHIITFFLLTLSYSTNFTRVGNLVLSQMDLVDIVLPTAKMCKYAGYNTLADVWFAIFLGSWIITRHIFFPMTIYFLTFQLDGLVDYHWSPEQGYFLNATLHTVFIALLVCLECILCAWLLMILKVVQKVLRGEGADDVRSDSELSDDESDDKEKTTDKTAERPQSKLAVPDQLGMGQCNGHADGLRHRASSQHDRG